METKPKNDRMAAEEDARASYYHTLLLSLHLRPARLPQPYLLLILRNREAPGRAEDPLISILCAYVVHTWLQDKYGAAR